MNFYEKNFTAAIFDMDGTMFDTERLRMDVLKKASKEIYGKEIGEDFLYNCLGISAVKAESLAKDTYGESYPYRKIRERADDLEREYVRTHGVPVKDGLYNLLERLKKNNIFIALATSSQHVIAEEYLINAKVYRYFDIIVCGDEVEKGKPDPEIFIKAANELQCSPSDCLIFEDSQNGLLAASASGGIPIYIKDLKDPELQVKNLAFKAYEKMTDFLTDFISFIPKCPMPQLNEHFPLNQDNITVGIHGFGAIGGGYLAPVFSHWDGYTRPHKIIGATRNPLMIELVNSMGKYRIRYESQAYFQTLSNIHLISTQNEADMISMYEESRIIGLALPENVIRLQAKIIAKGLKSRYDNGGSDLTIMIVMNKVNAARFVKNHIRSALNEITDSVSSKKYLARTHFTETVVNRMVVAISEDFIISKFKNDLYQFQYILRESEDEINKISDFFTYNLSDHKVKTSNKRKQQSTSLVMDKNLTPISISETLSTFTLLSKSISEISVTLFSSESDMPLYAAKGDPIVEQLRQVITVEDIGTMQQIKNKLSNGTHAIIAWYSKLLNYKTIGQGMGDSRVKKLAFDIMKKEIAPALLIENPEYQKYINSFITSFITRCRYSFKDNCSRVGRDVMRKLQNKERILGAIQMTQKYGIPSDGLEFGAACAILCSVLDTKSNDSEIKKVISLYEKQNKVADVLAYDGEYNKKKYNGLDREKDKELIDRIQKKFDQLREDILRIDSNIS